MTTGGLIEGFARSDFPFDMSFYPVKMGSVDKAKPAPRMEWKSHDLTGANNSKGSDGEGESSF